MKDDKFNYLNMDKNQFIFNNCKTQGKYNSVIVPIDVHFLKAFYNEDIIKSQDIPRILSKIFGKSIGSSIL
jgi:hypothetical protein